MKQRSTFIVSESHGTLPENFSLKKDSFTIKALPPSAVREDRVTFGVHELPAEIQDVLSSCREVHLKFTSGNIYESIDPYSSRTPAGLHVFLSPEQGASPDSICQLLEKAFGVNDCRNFKLSFIGIPRSYQFYSPLRSASTFVQYLQNHLSEKDTVRRSEVKSLESAEYIDVTYNGIAQTLVLSSVHAPNQSKWDGSSIANAKTSGVELGVLGNITPLAEEGFTLAGFIAELGESDDFEPTMFSFASRHHRSESTFSLATALPTGLHPKLKLSIHGPVKPPSGEDNECTLNAYFTLPVALFIDKYQLSSDNQQLLDSLSIKRIKAISGETDLEAPVWTREKWGSRILVEVDTKNGENRIELLLPLHLRYLEPRYNGTITKVDFAWPSVFWACRSEEWKKMTVNPFDRLHLGWEDLFPEQVMYYHLTPTPHEGSEGTWGSINVPVLELENAEMIKIGTVAVVGLGFLWVLFKIFMAKFGSVQEKKELKKE
ncbi:PIG-X-domain-containing protein [Choiromyces venosus 120613-1]|uniref:Protein PBN1 n=1 Tax=Choiromyces venosus 120613-1 TaxID=1336337 RepID=A0A3N4JNU3_9PEZI|nr:PIG-X-domain-containing protein [Choiromyces venosus 120613-1]